MKGSFTAAAVVSGLGAVIAYDAPADVRPFVISVMLAAVMSTIAASRWPKALAWGLSSCVVGYAVALGGRPELDPSAPLIAAALLVVGEIVGSSHGVALPGAEDRTVRRAVETAGLGLAAIAVAAAVLAGAALRLRGSVGSQLVGAGAAVGVFAIIRHVAASKRPRSRT